MIGTASIIHTYLTYLTCYPGMNSKEREVQYSIPVLLLRTKEVMLLVVIAALPRGITYQPHLPTLGLSEEVTS
jgi:hypothetical protein